MEDVDDEGEQEEKEKEEEGLICYYFFRGFLYKEIQLLLDKNNGIKMSESTLK